MDPSLERQVQGIAVTRIGLGTALLLLPGPLLRLWLGRQASTPFSRLMARSAGGRDVALGLGTLLALRHRAPVRGWLEASMLSDTSDALAVLLASRHLSRARLLFSVTPAIASVGYGRMLVNQVATEAPAETVAVP
jgi:hypothetical protein